jgi:anthraniloyl-CoA monooxygenase
MSQPSLSRIAIVGGGPGGLFLASLLKRRRPGFEVTVFEQNRRTDTFGFGVVFSDATLRNIDEADPALRGALRDHGTHWDRIEVWSNGQRHGFAGNGMAAIHRKALLEQLQQNAKSAGAVLRFGSRAPSIDELLHGHDVVIGADGTNSGTRRHLEAEGSLGHEVEVASAKFAWFGTTHRFDGLTFVHRVAEHGNFAAHAYPISDELSTFIVETDHDTWRRAGLDAFDVDQPPGPSDTGSQAYLEHLFADDIPGAHLVANNSRWANFLTRSTARWWRGNVVLLGDAVHTAHFSVGSGTKMAMEDSVVLADELLAVAAGEKDLDAAFSDYQAVREASVGRVQAAAGPSLSWWEHFDAYHRGLDPLTFAFHFFSRSIGIDRIEQRDPALAACVRERWRARLGAPVLDSTVELTGPSATVTMGRRLELRPGSAGLARLSDADGAEVEVPLVVVAEDGGDVTHAARRLPTSGSVVVYGPASLARTRAAEEARLGRGLVTVIAGADLVDASAAETLVLSGRADAVAVPVAEPMEVP